MAILTLIIDYKGKQIKKHIKLTDDELTENLDIYILITNKHSRSTNYHFIYDIIDNSLIIPETVCMPKESAIITINLLKSNKSFIIRPHCIGSLGMSFNKSLRLNVDINF